MPIIIGCKKFHHIKTILHIIIIKESRKEEGKKKLNSKYFLKSRHGDTLINFRKVNKEIVKNKRIS